MAAEETGMGVVEDKVIKNHFASEYIYNKYKDEKTCGVVAVDDEHGIMEIAEPVGVICGIIPTTNPTSTAIFKALISLKTTQRHHLQPAPEGEALDLRSGATGAARRRWPRVLRKTSLAGSMSRPLSYPKR